MSRFVTDSYVALQVAPACFRSIFLYCCFDLWGVIARLLDGRSFLLPRSSRSFPVVTLLAINKNSVQRFTHTPINIDRCSHTQKIIFLPAMPSRPNKLVWSFMHCQSHNNWVGPTTGDSLKDQSVSLSLHQLDQCHPCDKFSWLRQQLNATYSTVYTTHVLPSPRQFSYCRPHTNYTIYALAGYVCVK